MNEVGKEVFLELIHSGDWSDSEGMTETEEEYVRLVQEKRNAE